MKGGANTIESRASRYLDGDLHGAELNEFNALLESSSEVQNLLRELELIRTTARAFPTLTAPDPSLESALFQSLFAEDDHLEEESRRRVGLFPFLRGSLASVASSGVGRAALAVPVILLLLIAGNSLTDATVTADGGEAIASFHASGEQSELVRSVPPSAEPTLPESRTVSATRTMVADPAVVQSGMNRAAAESADIQRTSSTPNEIPFAEILVEKQEEEDQHLPAMSEQSRPDPLLAETREVNPQLEADLRDLFRDDQPEQPGSSNSFLSASYRHGVATFVGAEETIGQDLSIRIDGEFSGGHRLSLSVGSSPLLVSERTYTVRSGIDEKGNPTPASIRTDESARADGEIWAGLGYAYSLFKTESLKVEAGVSLGMGGSSTRYVVEIPARIALTDKVGLEVVPYISRVTPHDREIRDSESDLQFNQFGEEWTPNTTSLGAQVGISLSFGR